MRIYDSVGIGVPEVLLPGRGIDLTRWAVVACDQYTAQPEYWKSVEKYVGGAPSTLNLIYPEVYLGEAGAEERIRSIRESMERYLTRGILTPREGVVYVERLAGGKIRKGLVLCIDLENYDYTKGSTSLIRASEGTILERIPPRIKIREGAKLELPHIMILIDDPENSVLGPLTAEKDKLEKLYDFELMMDSGHLTGYLVGDSTLEMSVVKALEKLADQRNFAKRYGLPNDTPVILFAMGDGNHSLATAKAIWEKTKEGAPDTSAAMNGLTRFAMVELVNLHDESLDFEPIHRVVFEIRPDLDLLNEMENYYEGRFGYQALSSFDELQKIVDRQRGEPHKVGVISPQGVGVASFDRPDSNLPVGSLQMFLDKFLQKSGAKEIDYVHGIRPVIELGGKQGNIAFYLPAMNKHDLFKTVIVDGALPRKTFSMGEAEDKRFYMECRRIG
jgi:uncharacterized protein (DUF1015 family)